MLVLCVSVSFTCLESVWIAYCVFYCLMSVQLSHTYFSTSPSFPTHLSLWSTERLLAAQNPLSQADRPHQIFADAPPSHPVPPPENRPTQKAPERILHPQTIPNMQPIVRAPPPLFSKFSHLCTIHTYIAALHSDHYRQVPLVGTGCCGQVAALHSDHYRQVPFTSLLCSLSSLHKL